MKELLLLVPTALILFYFIFISIWKINKELIHKPLEWIIENIWGIATMILFLITYIGLETLLQHTTGGQ